MNSDIKQGSQMKSYENYAFISYRHHPKDKFEAKLLQKMLEWYRLPKTTHNEVMDSKFLRRIWRDESDGGGELNDNIKKNLANSKKLILVCSTHVVESDYINDKEVGYFINELKRGYDIIPYIISGRPHSSEECFPQSLLYYYKDNEEHFGYSIKELGRRKAMIHVIADMLGLQFDSLWKRHKRYTRKVCITLCIIILFIMALVTYLLKPVNLEVTLTDDVNNVLPALRNGKLTVNGAEYPVENANTTIKVSNLSVWLRGKDIPLVFTGIYYDTIKVMLPVGYGFNQKYSMSLRRDKTFCRYAGVVIDQDEHAVEGALVDIEGHQCLTNQTGFFSIDIPIEEQTCFKAIRIVKKGVGMFESKEEWPRDSLRLMIK